jgi:hypothetical protein
VGDGRGIGRGLGGAVFETVGDAVCAAFASPAGAVIAVGASGRRGPGAAAIRVCCVRIAGGQMGQVPHAATPAELGQEPHR